METITYKHVVKQPMHIKTTTSNSYIFKWLAIPHSLQLPTLTYIVMSIIAHFDNPYVRKTFTNTNKITYCAKFQIKAIGIHIFPNTIRFLIGQG